MATDGYISRIPTVQFNGLQATARPRLLIRHCVTQQIQSNNMEPIKIVDKLTLRQEALRMALERANANSNIHNALKLAEEYEEYLLGNVDLPEYEDTHKDFKEMLGKMQESFKPKPFDLWFHVDGDIKPPHNTDLLVRSGGCHYIARTDGEDWYTTDTDMHIRPTHWMWIPTCMEEL